MIGFPDELFVDEITKIGNNGLAELNLPVSMTCYFQFSYICKTEGVKGKPNNAIENKILADCYLVGDVVKLCV